VQGKMPKAQKNRASKQGYTSPAQLILAGFETPFSKKLDPANRWVRLAHKIPWDTLVSVCQQQMNNKAYGADGINPRVVIDAIMIKHICDLSDRETVQQIKENMYMQYFIGYSSFSDEEPFDPSLFVGFRKRLGAEQINLINERIMRLSGEGKGSAAKEKKDNGDEPPPEKGVTVEDKEQPERFNDFLFGFTFANKAYFNHGNPPPKALVSQASSIGSPCKFLS